MKKEISIYFKVFSLDYVFLYSNIYRFVLIICKLLVAKKYLG